MSILIKGMEMPTDGSMIFAIRPDGMVEDVMGCYVGKAVPVPTPHGRLIDAEKIYDAVEQRYRISSGIEHRCERDLLDLICAAPTVLKAEEGE